MKNVAVRFVTIFILAFGFFPAFGQNVSEEARRYFDRGTAAMEMKDFQAAIKEFGQAVRLAPHWPNAVYNLGVAQEAAEKYEDAIKSYRDYVRLAPNADDVEEIKTLINKLEYKAEREKTLTIADIAEIIASIGNEEIWDHNVSDRDHHTKVLFSSITRAGNNRIKVPNMLVRLRGSDKYQVVEEESYKFIGIDGPFVKFTTERSDVGYPIVPPFQTLKLYYEIEVLSQTLVKVSWYAIVLPSGGYSKYYHSETFVIEYRKIQ